MRAEGWHFLGMMFWPIANGCPHRHKTRIGRFVTAHVCLSGTFGSDIVGFILGKCWDQQLPVLSGMNAITEPGRPTPDAFFERVQVRCDTALSETEMGQVESRWI